MKKEDGGFAYNDARLARRWKRRALMSLNLNNCNKEAQRKKLCRNDKSFHVSDVVDLESSNNEAQRKKFHKNNKNGLLKVDDEMVDMDYMMFLNSSTGLFSRSNQADGVVVDGDNDCRDVHGINDNEVDPDYKIFMDKLRKNGDSYAVEFDLSSGASVLIKYEVEDGSCMGLGSVETVTAANSRKEENVATTRVLRSASKQLNMDSPIELDDVLSKGSTKSPRTFRSLLRRDKDRTEIMSPVAEKKVELEAKEPISFPTTRCSSKRTSLDINQTANKKCKYKRDCNIIDESYQEFLNYLNDLGEENTESPLTSVSRRDRAKTQRKSPVADKNVELEAEEPVSCLITQCASKRPSRGIRQTVQQKCKYETNFDILDECCQEFAKCLKNDLSKGNVDSPRTLKSVWRNDKIGTERKSSVIKKNVELEVEKPVMKYGETDECYQEFLNGENLAFNPENTKNEKDKETLSDSDIIAVGNYPFSDGKDNPFVPSKSYHSLELNNEDIWVRSSALFKTSRSSFREKLMDCLRKPFSKKEYDDLLSEVFNRKPMELVRQFRNGTTRPYTSEACGKSYLDCHGDLAEKIKLYAMNRPKVLNLLRGFFYWLSNVAHEGAFRPWLDSACLEVMPEVLPEDFACETIDLSEVAK